MIVFSFMVTYRSFLEPELMKKPQYPGMEIVPSADMVPVITSVRTGLPTMVDTAMSHSPSVVVPTYCDGISMVPAERSTLALTTTPAL